MSSLAGRSICLGVSGGIAAYKAVELLRLLTRSGADVEVVMTRTAAEFVGPITFSALAHKPAKVAPYEMDDPIPHTRLGQWADIVVVAPATAHLLGRYAGGIAGDLLSNVLLATRAPVVLACAMHTEMWEQPAVQRNVATLRSDGVICIDPEVGLLAGGDEGIGRMAAPDTILAVCEDILGDSAGPADRYAALLSPEPHRELVRAGGADLAGQRILVTAGGTREPIDPVRYLGNRSSGKMGTLIAEEAVLRGADVTLVTTMSTPSSIPSNAMSVVEVETAEDMAAAVLSRYDDTDVVVMAAAVADFRPAAPAATKLKKQAGPPTIILEKTPDILAELGERKRDQVLVGFAAETENVAACGVEKAVRKNLDFLVANLVGVPDSGFASTTNRVWLCDRQGVASELGLIDKTVLAREICNRIVESLSRRDMQSSTYRTT